MTLADPSGKPEAGVGCGTEEKDQCDQSALAGKPCLGGHGCGEQKNDQRSESAEDKRSEQAQSDKLVGGEDTVKSRLNQLDLGFIAPGPEIVAQSPAVEQSGPGEEQTEKEGKAAFLSASVGEGDIRNLAADREAIDGEAEGANAP